MPREDFVIIKVLEQKKKIGIIELLDDSIEKSSLGEVLIPNSISYYRDGKLRESTLKAGDKVRFPTGNVGTGVPEAPDGEKWLAIPEDAIYYVVSEI